MKRNLAVGLVVRTGSRAIGSLLQAVFLLLLARTYGAEQFGVFAIVLAAGYIASAVSSLGTSARVLRLSAEEKPNELAASYAWLRLLGAAISFLTCLVVGQGNFSIALVAAAFVASDQIVDYAQAYFAGLSRQSVSALIVIIHRALPLLALVLALTTDTKADAWILVAFAMSGAGAIVVSIFPAARPLPLFSVLRSSIGYWLSGLVPSLNQLQVPLLGALSGAITAGGYAIALRLMNPLTIFVTAMQTVFVPELARRAGQPGFNSLFRGFIWIAGAYAVALSAFSPVIADAIIYFLGQDYRGARSLLIAMIVSAGLSGVAQAFQSKLVAIGAPNGIAWVIGISNLFGLGLLALVVGTLGESWLWVCPIVIQGLTAVGLLLSARRSGTRMGTID